MAEDKNKSQSYVEFARELFKKEKTAWSRIYEEAKKDAEFLSDDEGSQWNGQDFQERQRSGRPALQMDKLGQFTRQVVNQIRMNTPTINVIPAKNADEETADVFKGLIKDIEYKSNADDAYDTAALYSVRTSFGWLRVDHDYTDNEGFEQDLKICRVVNPMSVYIDSCSIEQDGSDAKHAFVLEQMRVSEFKEQYPDYAPVCFDEPSGNQPKEDDLITVAEFFKIEEEGKEYAQFEDGSSGEYLEGEPRRVKNKRTIRKKSVKRCKMSGQDVLEETTFPGRYIPIVPVYGEEFWVNGQRQIYSLIRKAKQAQQLHNWWKSKEAEILMKQTESPFMAAEGAIEEYAEDWKQPDKAAVLRYKTVDAAGNPIPPPQRVAPPQTATGVFQASLASVDDIRAAVGMYNANVGNQSNETSGIAIRQRQQQGETGTYHFADNLSKAIAQVGRILVFAIPEIYDTARIIRTIGDEEDVEQVGINGEVVEGQERTYNLTEGKYDVRVTTGSSFTTMRQEAADFFTQVINQRPDLMQVIGDLAFKYMDIPGAQAISERIKKTIPPQFLDEEQDPQVVQLQQVIQQGQAAIQQMQAEMGQMQQQLGDKQAELQIKAQSEANKAETDRMKIQVEQMQAEFENEQAKAEIAIKMRELDIKNQELEMKRLEAIASAQAQEIALVQSIANNGMV